MRTREGTSDARVWKTVYRHNEYGLLDVAGKSVIDIGANIGAFACLAAEGGAAVVIAVEPFGPNFAMLEHNARDHDNLIVMQRALAARSNETVNLPSLAEHIEANRQQRGRRGVNFGVVQASATGSDEVATISLPEILKDHQLERLDLLKIDCEGGEWSVLAALEPADFACIGEVCGEYHLYPEYTDAVTDEPVPWLRSRFEQAGFEIVIEPHPTDPTLGTFHAQRASLERPVCKFAARAFKQAQIRMGELDETPALVLDPGERLLEAFLCLQSSRDQLKAYSEPQEEERTELAHYVSVLKATRNRLRAKLEQRLSRLAHVLAEADRVLTRQLAPFDAAWRARVRSEVQPKRAEFDCKWRKLRRDPHKFFEDSKAKPVVALLRLAGRKT